MFENKKLKRTVENLAGVLGYNVLNHGILFPKTFDSVPVTRGELKQVIEQINAIMKYLKIEIAAEFHPEQKAKTEFTVRKISKRKISKK